MEIVEQGFGRHPALKPIIRGLSAQWRLQRVECADTLNGFAGQG